MLAFRWTLQLSRIHFSCSIKFIRAYILQYKSNQEHSESEHAKRGGRAAFILLSGP